MARLLVNGLFVGSIGAVAALHYLNRITFQQWPIIMKEQLQRIKTDPNAKAAVVVSAVILFLSVLFLATRRKQQGSGTVCRRISEQEYEAQKQEYTKSQLAKLESSEEYQKHQACRKEEKDWNWQTRKASGEDQDHYSDDDVSTESEKEQEFE
eukprot:GILK01001088.1.p1 GENE.GILK01001088.1~~GILK01001088.1.p1  ORF type:complete len:153 (-),score=26.64 GILK01001088.1:124-582(-)